VIRDRRDTRGPSDPTDVKWALPEPLVHDALTWLSRARLAREEPDRRQQEYRLAKSERSMQVVVRGSLKK